MFRISLYKIVGVCILSCLLAARTPAHADVPLIIHQWKDYIASISSLRLEGQVTTKVPAGIKPSVMKTSFIMNGNRYRAELNFVSFPTSPFTTIITAYDGHHYQGLYVRDNAELQISSRPTNTEPYIGTNPLIMTFDFMFQPGDFKSMDNLLRENIWNLLSKRITESHRADRNGIAGMWLSVDLASNKSGSERFDIFTSEATGLPLFWRKTDKASNTVLSDVEVSYEKIKSGDGTVLEFPTALDFTSHGGQAGDPLGLTISIVRTSIKINSPIPAEIFTLPATQADKVIQDNRQIDEHQ